MVLSASLVKVGGALFKVPLSSLLTGSGMGLFMASYSIFGPFFALFASGLSPAVSSLVSRTRALNGEREASMVCRANLIFFSVYAFLVYLLFIKVSPLFCRLAGDEALIPCIYAIAPCMFFCTLSSVIKGGFEGKLTMVPTAFSNLLEVSAKFISGLWLAKLCLENIFSEFYLYGSINGQKCIDLNEAACKAIPLATASALDGVALAGLISCGFLLMCFLKDTGVRDGFPKMHHFKVSLEILRFSLPVCLSSLIISLYPSIDMYTFMKLFKGLLERGERLPASLSPLLMTGMEKDAVPSFLYGCYSALAMTVFHLVPSVASSFSVAVLPVVSGLYAKGNTVKTETVVEGVIRSAAFICFPMGTAMSMMPREILYFFFRRSPLEVEFAVGFLRILGIAGIFVGLTSPVFAILQGIGKEKIPVRILFLFLWLKLLLNVSLSFIEEIGPFAPAVSTLIAYIFIFVSALKKLSYNFNRRFSFYKIIIRPFTLSLSSCFFVKVLFHTLSKTPKNPLILAISGLLGALMYILLMLLTGEFKQEYIKILYCNKNA